MFNSLWNYCRRRIKVNIRTHSIWKLSRWILNPLQYEHASEVIPLGATLSAFDTMLVWFTNAKSPSVGCMYVLMCMWFMSFKVLYKYFAIKQGWCKFISICSPMTCVPAVFKVTLLYLNDVYLYMYRSLHIMITCTTDLNFSLKMCKANVVFQNPEFGN